MSPPVFRGIVLGRSEALIQERFKIVQTWKIPVVIGIRDCPWKTRNWVTAPVQNVAHPERTGVDEYWAVHFNMTSSVMPKRIWTEIRL
jgi:hypothetical protein